MNDMTQAIVPKSDQLNADDLIGRELTIKITGVDIRGGQEQPVSIHFDGDNGKPYKACKSMCRVMVSAWGADASKYVGRSMTLYRDPSVKWGGMEVGGIRISHMSHIEKPMTMALTMTRANKKPFTVKPLEQSASADDLPAYPAEAFTKNLPTWTALIQKGDKTAEQIIATVSRKAVLSDAQKATINAVKVGTDTTTGETESLLDKVKRICKKAIDTPDNETAWLVLDDARIELSEMLPENKALAVAEIDAAEAALKARVKDE
jgi:hypothetical protein